MSSSGGPPSGVSSSGPSSPNCFSDFYSRGSSDMSTSQVSTEGFVFLKLGNGFKYLYKYNNLKLYNTYIHLMAFVYFLDMVAWVYLQFLTYFQS